MDKKLKVDIKFEGYISVIQEREVPTKFFINKRAKNARKKPPYENKCCF